jgi:hypothetical protein
MKAIGESKSLFLPLGNLTPYWHLVQSSMPTLSFSNSNLHIEAPSRELGAPCHLVNLDSTEIATAVHISSSILGPSSNR